MKSKLRILHLEDERKDSELVQSTIMKAGIDCDMVRVETRDDFISNLEECGFDVVFLDYTIPGFDGLSALALEREKCPDTPVIFVSGTIGEDFAIETLKKGATDYVLKERLSRLLPAVTRALREADERTKRKRVEEALRTSEQRFRSVIDQAADAFFIHNTQGQIVDVNKRACQSLGYTREELLSKTIADIDPEAIEKGKDKLWGKVIEGETAIFESRHKRKGGNTFPVEITLGAIYLDHETLILAVVRDITERKLVEEALLKEKRFTDLAINSLPGVFYLFDDKGRLLRWNRNLKIASGYSDEEISQMNPLDFFAGEEKKLAEDAIREVFIKGESKVEANLISKDGGKKPYFFTGLRFVSDNQTCLIGMGIDITERKKAEEKINHLLDIITRAKEEWELTFDNVTEIILLIDRDLRILRCNKSFSEFAGISINEIIGKKCYDFIPCDQKQIGYCMLSLRTGERLRRNEFQTKTGRWFYESHCPIIDENGKFYFSVIVATDITDLKNTHQSLIEYQEELKDRVRELEDFYEMGVGRELKMIELKKELERIKEELEKYKKDA